MSNKETIEEVAERIYREYPNNQSDKPEWDYNRDVNCFRKRKAFIKGAKWQAERMYSQAVNFAEWIRIKDFQTANKDNWIGLDMKYYTTKELFEQFKQKSNEQFKNK